MSGASTDITRFSTPIAGNVGGGGDAPPPGSTPGQQPSGSSPGIATATDGFVAAGTGYRFVAARGNGVGVFRSIGYGLGGNPALLPPTNIVTNVAGVETTVTQVLTTTPGTVTLPSGITLNNVLTVRTATNATTYIHPANVPANFSAPAVGGSNFTGSTARALARTIPPPAAASTGAGAFGFLGGIFRMLPFIGAFLALCDMASSASTEEALSNQKVFDDLFGGYPTEARNHIFRLYSQKKFEGPGGLREYLTQTLQMDEESVNNIVTQLKNLPKAQEEAANDRKWNTWLTLGGLALGIFFGVATGGVGFAAWGAIATAGATGMCWGNLLNMGRRYVGAPDLAAFGRGAGRTLSRGTGLNNSVYTPAATATA